VEGVGLGEGRRIRGKALDSDYNRKLRQKIHLHGVSSLFFFGQSHKGMFSSEKGYDWLQLATSHSDYTVVTTDTDVKVTDSMLWS